MKKIIIYIEFYLPLFILIGCSNVPDSYSSYKTDFFNNKKNYENMVRHIEKTYIDVADRSNISRKIILLCGDRSKFDSTDSRYCDNILEPKMKQLGISVIYVEKNVCFGTKNFDLVSFELNQPSTNGKMYLHYSYCDSITNEYFSNKSVAEIPIKGRWSIYVEKK